MLVGCEPKDAGLLESLLRVGCYLQWWGWLRERGWGLGQWDGGVLMARAE